MIDISEWICICVGMYFKMKNRVEEEIASCICVYVCLSAMIDLRNIQSMCGETWRRVYWYIPRGTSYLNIDTHHTREDKKNCNRDGQLFSFLSLSRFLKHSCTHIYLLSRLYHRIIDINHSKLFFKFRHVYFLFLLIFHTIYITHIYTYRIDWNTNTELLPEIVVVVIPKKRYLYLYHHRHI